MRCAEASRHPPAHDAQEGSQGASLVDDGTAAVELLLSGQLIPTTPQNPQGTARITDWKQRAMAAASNAPSFVWVRRWPSSERTIDRSILLTAFHSYHHPGISPRLRVPRSLLSLSKADWAMSRCTNAVRITPAAGPTPPSARTGKRRWRGSRGSCGGSAAAGPAPRRGPPAGHRRPRAATATTKQRAACTPRSRTAAAVPRSPAAT